MSSAACAAVRARRPMWSVGYKVLATRPPTADERARGAKRVIVKWQIVECSPVREPAGTGVGTMEVRCD
jgi:hypothetical protein